MWDRTKFEFLGLQTYYFQTDDQFKNIGYSDFLNIGYCTSPKRKNQGRHQCFPKTDPHFLVWMMYLERKYTGQRVLKWDLFSTQRIRE